MMRCSPTDSKRLAYGVVLVGCLLALATAFNPQPTGALYLAAGYLVRGLLPYVVYGSLTEIVHGCLRVVAGGVLLVTDLTARTAFG